MVVIKRFNSTVSKLPTISSTLILSRNPIITRELPAFEQQYYNYQNELWKRLMWTFPKWYYYRDGTLGDQRFKELNKPPVFNNPKLEYTEGRPDIKQLRDRRFKQVINLPKSYKQAEDGSEIVDEEIQDNLSRKINPNSRITKADESKDLSSLERQLSKTLYLIINENGWKLPTFKSDTQTPLHKVAEEGLFNIGGEEINYFNVSSKPCHHIKGSDQIEFFIKSHILSGSFKPKNLKFLWVTKDELSEYLNEDYYKQIKHLLNE
ncbi:54S ribosomal protein L17, mitochondrial [[Candida] jaroonii]|uniref:54S ribosomal protein L17, mitochondrial n=1 Tax=[Candida] jaroonii TaxID=467808 RepID=A0ACA9Y6V1_9ASCO|nr:54S ribosomal protein L17, mitochondrial [[Candida] jaroonii]